MFGWALIGSRLLVNISYPPRSPLYAMMLFIRPPPCAVSDDSCLPFPCKPVHLRFKCISVPRACGPLAQRLANVNGVPLVGNSN